MIMIGGQIHMADRGHQIHVAVHHEPESASGLDHESSGSGRRQRAEPLSNPAYGIGRLFRLSKCAMHPPDRTAPPAWLLARGPSEGVGALEGMCADPSPLV